MKAFNVVYFIACYFFRANGEQIRAQMTLEQNDNIVDLFGNGSSFSYVDAPVPEGYLDTTTNVYVYSGKERREFVTLRIYRCTKTCLYIYLSLWTLQQMFVCTVVEET